MTLASLQDALWIMGGFLALLIFLFIWTLRQNVNRTAREKNAGAAIPNFTETVILFQTLRGIIHEQKNLAREFNASFDKKVAIVRQFLAKSAEEQTALRNELHALQNQIATAREELATLRNTLRIEAERRPNGQDITFQPVALSPEQPLSDFIADIPARPTDTLSRPADTPSRPTDTLSRPPGTVRPIPLYTTHDDDTLQVIAKPEESDSLIDSWSGFDFAGIEEADAFDVPETPPDVPSDPELAREAFRTLLDIQPETPRNRPDLAIASGEFFSSDRTEEPVYGINDSGNGRDKGAPLRARVYAYYDAGMTVSEIARELGIGKGEARLMLNLRDRDERQRQRS